jgi:hypothetical protein
MPKNKHFKRDRINDPRGLEDLAPARGALLGSIMGACIWLVVIAAAFAWKLLA